MKKVKRLFAMILSAALVLNMSVASFAIDTLEVENAEIHMEQELQEFDVILYQYSQKELESTVFTMELFNSMVTREEVAKMIALNKAANSESTYAYRSFDATESEISEFYAELEELAASGPALNYYFSNVYWRMRTDVHYGANTISLTLVPNDVIKNDNLGTHTAAAWALVKAECGSSDKWTNESSLKKQFECHALGETAARLGLCEDVGDWDLEPIRPDVSLFDFVRNKCNPTG